ncbi:Response regulator receiver domain-containing protein [Verrucomicrobium sp. GAS474]|uniref:response regulator n=1 Tax=Verrucomicrobium sp. GAS474 TaxID=1882831 RepID=UPI00087C85DE|nr:response regulator [Verrucomicrobium sp. GAS474]SDU13156.1 Response regulator receiver domain-containing protein [Verrucomicrobium sp. GAS474]
MPSSPSQIPPSSPQEDPIRVIVTEDNEDDRILLLRQLKNASMAEMVKFIDDGEQAVRFFQKNTPALAQSLMVLFLDLKLPSLNGIEVLRQLREIPSLNHIPVIVMTSSNDPADIVACRALGVTKWIEKPITFDSFSKAIADTFHQPGG